LDEARGAMEAQTLLQSITSMTSQLNDIDKRIPTSPPPVPPAEETIRPLWSIMVPVYNCSQYLTETLVSVLKQCKDRPDVQIEVIDDASTDANVRDLVRAMGQGRVGYFRHEQNVGSLRNFHTCLLRAKGVYVHILHGDDRVRDGFYQRMEKFFTKNRSAGAVYCRYAYINEHSSILYHHEKEYNEEGIIPDFLSRLGERQRIQYAAIVVKREVYETLGFYGVEYGEDWEMWMRIAAKYPIGYIPDVLAEYRKHSSSISGRSFLTGKNMRDLTQVMQRIEPLLPAQQKDKIIKSSRKFYAHYALRTANQIWSGMKHRAGVMAQVREAWRMHKDASLIVKIVKLYTKMALNL
jgi:glycosyltransferase involved in cell wall biosynthesis